MKVEVELEDLETIIFSTAAIKQIESALSTRKHDPFVKPYLAYTVAHNNLVSVMTHAKRSQNTYATPWDGELTDKEIQYLQALEVIESNKDRRDTLNPDGYDRVSGDQRMKHGEVDSLLSKGCIKMGVLCHGVVWAGDNQPTLKQEPEFGVMLTPRGKDKLEKTLMKKAEAAGLLDEAS